MEIDETAWGQLVSLTDFETPPILLTTDEFKMGRSEDCDFSLPGNRLVSGSHCRICRKSDGKVLLFDSSTNGTVVNLTEKISKGKSRELRHGDEFHLVYKKSEPEFNVGFVYQDMAELAKEDDSTQDYSQQGLDATLEDSDCNHISPEKEMKKRKSEEDMIEESNPVKKPRAEVSCPVIPGPSKAASVTEGNNETTRTSGQASKTESEEVKITDKVYLKNAETELKSEKGELVKDVGTGIQSVNTEENKAETDSKEDKGEENKGKQETSDDAKAETGTGKTESKAETVEHDDIEENLQCLICQEIMHDCISLQPCLHSFCAGCYSGWMNRSQECPSCRRKVRRITKNHIVNNLIEAYLKEHPAKKRPEEDLKDLDKKNKITKDMLYPQDDLDDYDSSDYADTDDDDNDGGDAPPAPAPPAFNFPAYTPPQPPALFGFGTPLFGVNRAFRTVCRQCPDYKDPLAGTNTGVLGGLKTVMNTVKTLITGDGNQDTAEDRKQEEEPSTSGGGEPAASTSGENAKDNKTTGRSDDKVMPTVPDFVCGAQQNHVLCQCCLQPMPDLRLQGGGVEQRPQQCGMCYRAYCHAYWGCRKADCLGCLDIFKDMNFGRKALQGLILDNHYESEIFRDYLDAKGMSVRDVLAVCCTRMEAGQYTVTAQATHRFNSNMAVCYACGLGSFKQLAFQYRKSLKKEDFPEAVRARPDCYWGYKCRTQKNKPHHAKNYNHVCEQTRQY